jgi:hypothetical protein
VFVLAPYLFKVLLPDSPLNFVEGRGEFTVLQGLGIKCRALLE